MLKTVLRTRAASSFTKKSKLKSHTVHSEVLSKDLRENYTNPQDDISKITTVTENGLDNNNLVKNFKKPM